MASTTISSFFELRSRMALLNSGESVMMQNANPSMKTMSISTS